MASAWGASWGKAFGAAWGAATRPPPVESPPSYQGGNHRPNTYKRHPPAHEDARKRARRRADEDLLLAIL